MTGALDPEVVGPIPGSSASDSLAAALKAASETDEFKEAAAKAAGTDGAAEGAPASFGDKPSVEKPGGAKLDPDKGRALVDLLDTITGVICRIYASSAGIQWTPKLAAVFKLTPSERSQLAMLAPYAAPYIEWLLSHVKEIAAGLFAFVYWSMLADRLKLIKNAAPKKKEEPAKDGKEGKRGSSVPGKKRK